MAVVAFIGSDRCRFARSGVGVARFAMGRGGEDGRGRFARPSVGAEMMRGIPL